MEKIGKKTVLLVEDVGSVRKLLANFLEASGFSVIQAEDGEKAIKLYMDESVSIDAIVADLIMPKVSGIELAKFNYENRFLPFMVITTVSDAGLALELLEYGILDYIVKPVDGKHFSMVAKNLFRRAALKENFADDEQTYPGNVGKISIPSKLLELQRVNSWVKGKIENLMGRKEFGHFLNSLGEFFLNAYEHGSLQIGEKRKCDLIEEGRFEEELEYREMGCISKIDIAISALADEICVNVTDEGNGFNYEKYLNMTQDEVVARLDMPNGRGIYMASRYFDSIRYDNGGSSITVVKKINSNKEAA